MQSLLLTTSATSRFEPTCQSFVFRRIYHHPIQLHTPIPHAMLKSIPSFRSSVLSYSSYPSRYQRASPTRYSTAYFSSSPILTANSAKPPTIQKVPKTQPSPTPSSATGKASLVPISTQPSSPPRLKRPATSSKPQKKPPSASVTSKRAAIPSKSSFTSSSHSQFSLSALGSPLQYARKGNGHSNRDGLKRGKGQDQPKPGPDLLVQRKHNLLNARAELGEEQRAVLQRVLDGESVFFTGSAGTGKTYLLRHIIAELGFSNRRIGLTASTGIAASHFQGQTIHSWAGVGIGKEPPEKLLKKILRNKRVLERWTETEVLFIDEVSMLDGRFIDKLEYLARHIRESEKPFGGIQLVICGDLLQLPPVPDFETGSSVLCFEAESWKECVPNVISLSKVYRQIDPSFINLLNKMRLGTTTPRVDQLLSSRAPSPNDTAIYSHLYPVKQQVHKINLARLHALPGQIHRFTAANYKGLSLERIQMSESDALRLLNDRTIPDILDLKIDTQVILVKNESPGARDGSLVNGSLGIVTDFLTHLQASERKIETLHMGSTNDAEQMDSPISAETPPTEYPKLISPATHQLLETDDQGQPVESGPNIEKAKELDFQTEYPVVQFVSGQLRLVTPQTHSEDVWLAHKNRTVTLAKRTQIPLVLAWALSIHKSQGQTLSHVLVDFARIFETGQAYVAVSRCQTLDGLRIQNYSPHKVRASPTVLRWMLENNIQAAPDLPEVPLEE